MCVIAAKYFKESGWVAAKNRDRNYLPSIKIIQSNRKGVQRMYIYDEATKYTEGLNEFGVCIVSAAMDVFDDEKEREAGFVSTYGKKIRDALLEKSPQAALKKLIDTQLAGATLIFNERECWLLEAGFDVLKKDASKDNPREYKFEKRRLENKVGNTVVRTNHGVFVPEIGYQPNDDRKNSDAQAARKSSETRMKYTEDSLKKVKQVTDMLDGLAVKDADKDKFLNPIRLGNPEKGEMVTTGQLMLVAKERTLSYRPLFSEIEVNYSSLNGPDKKTYFEIVSSRDLIAFKEHYNPWK